MLRVEPLVLSASLVSGWVGSFTWLCLLLVVCAKVTQRFIWLSVVLRPQKRKAYWGREPRMSTLTFTQLLSSALFTVDDDNEVELHVLDVG